MKNQIIQISRHFRHFLRIRGRERPRAGAEQGGSEHSFRVLRRQNDIAGRRVQHQANVRQQRDVAQ